MSITQSQMRQLAYIRYLHRLAVDQAKLPEPMASTSVLLLHDAAESFLILAAKHFNLPDSGEFLGYWNLLKSPLGGKTLPMQQDMKILSNQRKELKHRGTHPGAQTIEDLVSSTATFLASGVQMVFDVDFSSISMVDLIGQDLPRRLTREAEAAAAGADIVTGMMRLREAFDQLFAAHRPVNGWQRPSDLSFGPELGRFPLSNMRSLGLEDEFKQVFETLQALQAAARMTALSIDFSDFVRFDLLTPSYQRFHGKGVVGWWAPRGYAPDQEAFDFCLQFVVTSSLRLAAAEARVSDPSWVTRDHVGRLEQDFLREEPLMETRNQQMP